MGVADWQLVICLGVEHVNSAIEAAVDCIGWSETRWQAEQRTWVRKRVLRYHVSCHCVGGCAGRIDEQSRESKVTPVFKIFESF